MYSFALLQIITFLLLSNFISIFVFFVISFFVGYIVFIIQVLSSSIKSIFVFTLFQTLSFCKISSLISNDTFISFVSLISTIGILGTITCHISTNFFVITHDIGALITELFILTRLNSLFRLIFWFSKSNSLIFANF